MSVTEWVVLVLNLITILAFLASMVILGFLVVERIKERRRRRKR